MSKIVDNRVVKTISKEMMEQYEKIRQTGATDMYSYYGVVDIARILEFKELAKISLKDYKILLLNFQRLMKYYDIKQPKINTEKTCKSDEEDKNANIY